MQPPERRSSLARWFHRAFEASLLLKGLFAASETLLGLALFFVANDAIRSLVAWVTAQEITEDPNDLLAQFLLHGAQAFSIDAQAFYATYLIGHGALKLTVVILLARGLIWAYPLAVAVLAGFVVYQVHRYLLAPSLGLVLLSLFDLVLIALTVVEYRRVRKSP